MNPTECRDITWTEMQGRIVGLRADMHEGLRMHGPCTTRQLAERMRRDILSVRPRVTELCELGFAECTGREGGEGIYRAYDYSEAARRFSEAKAIARGEGVQQELFR